MRFIVLLTFWFAVACKQPAPPNQSGIMNMDSLLQKQIKLTGNVFISKTLQVGNASYQTKVSAEALANELAAFDELKQINRPIYQSQYQVITTPHKQSNLTVRTYQAKTNVPVKSLRLFYLNQVSQLKRIEATLGTQDIYQSSAKKMTLDFSLLGDTLRLESYNITGSQQYFWSTPIRFSIHATIR